MQSPGFNSPDPHRSKVIPGTVFTAIIHTPHQKAILRMSLRIPVDIMHRVNINLNLHVIKSTRELTQPKTGSSPQCFHAISDPGSSTNRIICEEENNSDDYFSILSLFFFAFFFSFLFLFYFFLFSFINSFLSSQTFSLFLFSLSFQPFFSAFRFSKKFILYSSRISFFMKFIQA